MRKAKILVIHPGGIGDVLLALPAIRSLRRRYGLGQVALMAGRAVGELLVRCQEVGKLFPLESREFSDLLGGTIGSRSAADKWINACSLIIGWMSDHDGCLSAILSERGVAQIIIGSPLTGPFRSTRQSDRILETLRELKLDPPGEQPLNIPEAAIIAGRKALNGAGVGGHRSYVVVHPGSGSAHKCCEPALMADAVGWSYDKGMVPVLIGGPADRDSVDLVQARCSRIAPIITDTELIVIAGIIKEAALFIGHDSGMTHLAAALDVPSVACFGPTDEQRWSPRGNTVTVVRGKPCHCLTWEAVQRCHEKPCLAISVDELTSACAASIA
ncbi:MAG: glycosyltransferase family 9 protein [Nitrospiraceae bacterium]